MAKRITRKTTRRSRHGPDGAEVPLDRPDRGLTLRERTTYGGLEGRMAPSLAFRDTAAWLAWADDMRGQTGLEILLAIERDAREILDSDPVLRKRVAGEVQEWFRRVRLLKGAASALGDGARARRAAEVSALRKA